MKGFLEMENFLSLANPEAETDLGGVWRSILATLTLVLAMTKGITLFMP